MKDDSGSPCEVRLHPGTVAALVAALIGIGGKIAPAPGSGELVGQVTHVTGIQPAMFQGRPILDLHLEGTLHFPITFPADAIPAFQAAFARLHELTKSVPQPPAPKTH